MTLISPETRLHPDDMTPRRRIFLRMLESIRESVEHGQGAKDTLRQVEMLRDVAMLRLADTFRMPGEDLTNTDTAPLGSPW